MTTKKYPLARMPDSWIRIASGYNLGLEYPSYPKLEDVELPKQSSFRKANILSLFGWSLTAICIFFLGIKGGDQQFLIFCSIFGGICALLALSEISTDDKPSFDEAMNRYNKISEYNQILEKKYNEDLLRYESVKDSIEFCKFEWTNNLIDKEINWERPLAMSEWLNIKIDVTSESPRKVAIGVSEIKFKVQLKNDIRSGWALIHSTNTYDSNGVIYYPDLVLYHEDLEVFIDLEIDEPYILKTGNPIHHIESNDDYRDSVFLSSNWFVIRFTERQIIQEHVNCINYVNEILVQIENFDAINQVQFNGKIDKGWTEDEAVNLSIIEYREGYITI